MADTLTGQGGPADYDFLIGTWRFTFHWRRNEGYFAIQPDKFLWHADATFDRGKTWIADYWTMECLRISR